MSYEVNVKVKCGKCSAEFQYTLYRTIWGEIPENRALVMSDRINVSTCPSCRKDEKLEFPFMYTNRDKHFAVWWEPHYDPEIDRSSQDYAALLGEGNYMAAAPRIEDWDEFKETIVRFEKGELVGHKAEMTQGANDLMAGFVEHLRKQTGEAKEESVSQGGGCLVFILATVLAGSLCMRLLG